MTKAVLVGAEPGDQGLPDVLEVSYRAFLLVATLPQPPGMGQGVSALHLACHTALGWGPWLPTC